jgi:ribosomal protein S21
MWVYFWLARKMVKAENPTDATL